MVALQAATAEGDRERWNQRYEGPDLLYGSEPSAFLVEVAELLPESGRALDVAAGEGRNAVFLARRGLQVDAIDVSDVALAKTERSATEAGVELTTVAADLTDADLGSEVYDVIVVFNYLDRQLAPRIIRALRPGGVLVYETVTVDALEHGVTMRREYLLERGELGRLFADLEPVVSREDPRTGRAGLVARRP